MEIFFEPRQMNEGAVGRVGRWGDEPKMHLIDFDEFMHQEGQGRVMMMMVVNSGCLLFTWIAKVWVYYLFSCSFVCMYFCDNGDDEYNKKYMP